MSSLEILKSSVWLTLTILVAMPVFAALVALMAFMLNLGKEIRWIP